MKNICIFLNGSVYHDSRVKKTIRTLSKKAKVDLFYIDENKLDTTLFEDNVRLFPFKQRNNFLTNIIKHSFFHTEFDFLGKEALKKNIKYDIVYCNDLPTLRAGVLIKNKLHSKLVYDSHEIFIGTLNQIYSDKLPRVKKILMKCIIFFMRFIGNIAEKRMVRNVDVFITTSHSFKDFFSKKFKISDLKVVMNCPQKQLSARKVDLHEMFSLEQSDFILLYQGALTKGRALDKLIESMQFVNQGIKLVILGDGILKHELEQLTQKLFLENVFFKGFIPEVDLLSHTMGANVGINLQEPINISKKLASANKLFEYSHAGLPIIASDVPENRKIINEFENGVLIENDINIIAETINKMACEDLSLYCKNSFEAAKKYNWESQEKILLEVTQ
jgi:glycosyltransferase involved in cell wall biosynthesis